MELALFGFSVLIGFLLWRSHMHGKQIDGLIDLQKRFANNLDTVISIQQQNQSRKPVQG